MLAGVGGTLLLAVGWVPVNLWVMVVAVFLFGVTNVCARLVLTRWRQELTPLEHAGGVTAASEFGRTAASVGVDSLVGGAFASGAGAYGSFGIVGGMLGSVRRRPVGAGAGSHPWAGNKTGSPAVDQFDSLSESGSSLG